MEQLCINNYKDRKYLSSGADGKIYKVCNKSQCNVIKEMPSNVAQKEVQFLKFLRSSKFNKQHIHLDYYKMGVCDKCISKFRKTLDVSRGCTILEMRMYDGDLWSLIYNDKLTKQDLKALFIQIRKALRELYKINVYHNDLHAGNILFNKGTKKTWKYGKESALSVYHFYIADFSRAKHVKSHDIPLSTYIERETYYTRKDMSLISKSIQVHTKTLKELNILENDSPLKK